MARAYRPVERDQEFLLPPNMIDWLEEDHLVWFVIEAVKRLNTTVFHRLAKLGGVGRCGYDPDMVLTLFVYAMAHGVSSSRRIERLCRTDVAFRVICAQDVPDHTVLARFRQNHQDALAGLLTESLVLAAELGMASLGTVALDGTKIAGNASRDANRGEKRLRELAESYLDTVEAADQAEDALFGEDNRGDELPPQARDRSGRRARIEAALEQITTRRQQGERAEKEQAGRAGECEREVAEGSKGRLRRIRRPLGSASAPDTRFPRCGDVSARRSRTGLAAGCRGLSRRRGVRWGRVRVLPRRRGLCRCSSRRRAALAPARRPAPLRLRPPTPACRILRQGRALARPDSSLPDPYLNGLTGDVPPSPASPGSDCPQLRQAAATA